MAVAYFRKMYPHSATQPHRSKCCCTSAVGCASLCLKTVCTTWVGKLCHGSYRNTRSSWTSQFLTVSQKGCLKRKTHPQEERKHLFICSKTRDGENQMFSFFFYLSLSVYLSLSLWYVLSCQHLSLPFPPSSLSARFQGVGSFRLWFSVRYALGFQYCLVAVCMALLVLFFVFECFEDV